MSLLVYLSILAGSSLFFIASLFFGDGDSDHGGSHTHDTHGHDSHAHSKDDDGTDEADSNALQQILSIRNIFLFGVGFGAAGAISMSLGGGFILTLMLSGFFGISCAYVGYKLIRFFYKREMETVISLSHLLGLDGLVTVSIPEGGVGEIRAKNIFGDTTFVMARSVDGEAIPYQTSVIVEETDDGVVLVSRIKEVENGGTRFQLDSPTPGE